MLTYGSLPLTNNEVRNAPGIPQPMPGAWATSLFLSRWGEGAVLRSTKRAPTKKPPSVGAEGGIFGGRLMDRLFSLDGSRARLIVCYFFSAACAAASRAIGTR